MHVDAQALAQRLKALILEKGWNQSELARRAGMRPSNVSNYLRGTNLPNPKQLSKLAEALGVSPAQLLGARAPSEAALPNSLSLTQVPDNPGKLRLQLDQVVPAQLAGEVIGLLLNRMVDGSVALVDSRTAMAETFDDHELEPRKPRRFASNILDTLLPAKPPQPVGAKQIRQLDGAESEEHHRRGKASRSDCL